ncbi:GntR family transcriptional regulator [Pseudalkalibacillus hwajinpoensis]|uniref:GntR family transcriptional regulator n=1 Tax=Guptibacillus hwajinpoensis TaxID=208199 RepID=A0A4U1MAW6_9BACL|nr:GntR family transcriptional regulator [Pseudalkalibacillus hwajinpoensis]TKD67703.1 GntR family transcriptional regulator [Pseudalkalibacillus hwajinpoensis]
MIDKTSPLPIYYQLVEWIKGLIEQGELKPGDSLPSEREYAERFSISRMTVRQAITELVNSGYLYRQKGVGTFVAEKKIEQQLMGLTSFTEDMKSRGMEPSSKLVGFEIVPAPTYISEQLTIQKHAPVYEIKRIRLADGIPMALEKTYISANLVKGLTEEIVQNSLYYHIENQLSIKIDEATQVLESSVATQQEAEYLNIQKGAPVLLIQRNTALTDGTPLEIVKSSYRGDRYKFTITLKR